jgi:hypothetical protein
MRILLTSPGLIENSNGRDAQTIAMLISLSKTEISVGIISCRPKPAWFDGEFLDTGVEFVQIPARQDGRVIKYLANKSSARPYEILVLAATEDDLRMAKNGGAMLIAAGWVTASKVNSFGVKVKDTHELVEIIGILGGWSGHWWAKVSSPTYNICALADLSSFYKEDDQVKFSSRVTQTVKQGGVKETALLTICARSLLIDQISDKVSLAFGVYPSSSSSNDDNEVLSEFTHRLRTIVSQVHFAKKNEPLFIRHTKSTKRSTSSGPAANRLDPRGQIETIHLNPYYKNRIKKRDVIVVDDCTTYGASFAVAAAFLLKGGANSVTGIALGKFGNQLHHFEIAIDSDPFMPVVAGQYTWATPTPLKCVTNDNAQTILRTLL